MIFDVIYRPLYKGYGSETLDPSVKHCYMLSFSSNLSGISGIFLPPHPTPDNFWDFHKRVTSVSNPDPYWIRIQW